MSVLVMFLLFFVFFVSLVVAAPQIFTDTYGSCEFEYSGKKISFPDKLFTVSTKDFNLHFSFCKASQTSCREQTASCLIQKRNSQFIDLGREFILDEDSEDFTLISTSHTRCRQNPSKNYTLSITLLCTDSIKPKPRLIASDDEDECTFEVTMMKPNCQPKCTEIIHNSYLLDIRGFKKYIQVEDDSKKFSLSLCGSNRDCSGDISACEILKNEKVPLASIDTQFLSYDVGKNELTARGRYKFERIVRDVQILIKCNWDTELANPTYKKVPIQGKHYKFELESSFGCIKLPQKCAISSIENLHYNLSELFKPEGWEVTGVPQGKILVNICGPLNQQKSVCQDQHSQVCHISNTTYINRGSILSFLKANNDVIVANFISGSTCRANPTILYSTQIEFRCTRIEKGPVFKEYKDCVMFLEWETQRACPIDFYRGDNCYMNDRVSNRNLQKLYSETDKVYFLTSNKKTKLIYNLCGPIHETCNGYSNASFCLKTEQKEIVIGWNNKQLISENGLLRMELQGSLCSNRRSQGEIVIDFVCDYENPPPPTQIRVIEDSCKFNVTIFTPLACLSQTFTNCTYSTANLTYDLSELTLRNRNYIITDENIDFVFNLCAPVVGGPGALCRGDTMFCWSNKTEINVKHKYMSVGGVMGPRLFNNSLVVEATMGSYCEGLGSYKSVIHFECSKQKFYPILLSKEKCVYHFKWSTPEACPKERKCVVDSAKADTKLDLTQLQNKIIQFNVANKTNIYKFHLCSDTYTKYSDDLTNETALLKREYHLYEKNSFLVLDLGKKCENSSSIKKVIFELRCSQTLNDYYEQTSFDKCILNVTLYTNIVCPSPKEKLAYSIIEAEVSTVKNFRRESDTDVSTANRNKSVEDSLVKIKRNCTLTNAYTGYEFDFSKIAPQNNSLLTSNTNSIFVKMVQNMCPTPSFNYTQQTVILHYTAEKQCDSNNFYELEILLKCNQTKSGAKILKDEKCSFVLIYNLPEACLLLKQEIISAGNTSVVTGSVIGGLVILCILVSIFIYVKRRHCKYLRYVLRRDKSAVPIYIRDSRL